MGNSMSSADTEQKESTGVSNAVAAEEASDAVVATAAKEDEAKVNRLGTGDIWPLVIEFAIPAIIGMLVNAAYNLISAAFLGQALGTIGVSVTQVAQPIMTIFLAIAMMVGAGGNALCALRLGEGKHGEAEHVLGNTVSLSVAIAIVVAILAAIPPVLNGLLSISSTTEEIRPYAATYIQIICFGFVLQCIGFGVHHFIRTAGAPNRALHRAFRCCGTSFSPRACR